MKKILVLGAGNAQVDLVDYCKGHGFEVHACSYTRGDPAEKSAHFFTPIDISDVSSVAAYVKAHSIELVYSIGSDIAMPTVGRVSEELGLPQLASAWAATTCNSKNALRGLLDGKGYNVAHRTLRTEADAEGLPYPCMVKPVDSQGQRGVRRIDTALQLREHFSTAMSFSRKKELIAEEFIDGPEYSVNTYSVGGKVIFSLISDRVVWDNLPGGIIKEHRIPHTIASQQVVDDIQAMVVDVLSSLKIEEGPAYFQLKVEFSGRTKLVEVTPRLDGCHMWRLVEVATGVNLLDWTMRHLAGDVSFSGTQGRKPDPCQLVFMCQPPDSPFDGALHFRGPTHLQRFYYQQGETVRKMNGHMEKCGYFIRTGRP